MGLQISDYIKQEATIYRGTGLALLTMFLSVSAAVVNCAAPELTKSLVNLFKGEKNFTLVVSLLASISLALAMLGMAYLIYRHKSQILESTFKKEKDRLIHSHESQREVLELTVKREGDYFMVNGEDLKRLYFDATNKVVILTEDQDFVVIEKTHDIYKLQDSCVDPSKLNEEITLNVYQPNRSLQNIQIINAITCPTKEVVN